MSLSIEGVVSGVVSGVVEGVSGGMSRFAPNQLPGLAAWFRFNQGITSAASAVSQWADASGNARHLKQATGAAQPTVQGDGSILFDGAAHFLKCDPFTLIQPETVYLLFKQITWTVNDFVFDGNSSNSGSVAQISASPSLRVYAGGASGANNAGLALDTYGVMCAVFNGTSSANQINTGAPVMADIGTTSMGGFTLGALPSGGSNGNIQVKEAIIYSTAHDAATRNAVIAYLGRL